MSGRRSIVHTVVNVTAKEMAWRSYGSPTTRIIILISAAVLTIIHPLLGLLIVLPCVLLWLAWKLSFALVKSILVWGTLARVLFLAGMIAWIWHERSLHPEQFRF